MKKTMSISIDEKVISRLRAEAEAEKRSISQTIEILVEEALDAREKAAK